MQVIPNTRRMIKRNAFALILCALIIVVMAYCFWINIAH
jgi:hypothetical protein